MTTWTALTTLPGRDGAEALGLAMERMAPAPSGVGVFEIEDGSGLWEVGGYFEAPPDETALALLSAAFGAAAFTTSRLDPRDWVAQVRRELTPVPAGRFVVHGRHDRARIPLSKIGLEIEAAMAFGTGHHPTTLGCLLALDGLAQRGWRGGVVFDVGCGTGVLALGAARLWPKARVVAGDIDPTSVAATRTNARANRAPGVLAVEAAGLSHPVFRRMGPADLIFANILAGPLKRLAPSIAGALAPGGRAVLSGILTRQAAGVVAVARGHGLWVERRLTLGEWTTLLLRRGQ